MTGEIVEALRITSGDRVKYRSVRMSWLFVSKVYAVRQDEG